MLGLLLLAAVLVNPILDRSLEAYLRSKLELRKDAGAYAISFEALQLNIFQQEFQLEGIILQPEETLSTPDSLPSSGLQELRISNARIEGIQLSNFLWKKDLNIHSIVLDSVVLELNPGSPERHKAKNQSGGLLLDSLKLPGIEQVSLGDFKIAHLTSNLQAPPGETGGSRFQSSDLTLSGIGLRDLDHSEEDNFVPDIDSLTLHLGQQNYVLDDGLYRVVYDSLGYRHSTGTLTIDDLVIAPGISDKAFNARQSQQYSRYSTKIKAIRMEGVSLGQLMETGGLEIPHIAIEGMESSIYMDKSKPARAKNSVPLPAHQLANIGFPLVIDTLELTGANLDYKELLPQNNELLELSLNSITGEIRNIRTATNAATASDTLEVDLSIELLGAVDFSLQSRFPYGTDHFSFSGHTEGTSRLSTLNTVVYPALKMQFEAGNINGIAFTATGNTQDIKGELIMRYSDLEIRFYKANDKDYKGLSWAANALVKHSNPNRRGKLLIADIYFERDPSKGVVNYIWKGIQSGIINTFNPIGKHHRE
ncbi:hypothetical protein SAMN04490243_1197 [Robiginitalea myxolifaciens]|uniref:DUF748 domain-containing protein n=1 Tax=Robiginitalea myxolifaciens TaxID=400055 RepID=A0A1I6G3U8_9FLAO|nr:hypothetical protein [Robiginitalea myxolifaciens]SFR36875.1 hypothetical protein SAMN04490243_1197 [Robiginitalea myxolifaciens]